MSDRRVHEPIRCDECGRFVAFDDLLNGIATHRLITPDSDYSEERYASLCRRHAAPPTPAER